MPLLLPLMVMALAQQAQNSFGGSAFMQQAVGRPTGQNGYEEYSAASEIAETRDYQQFEAYKPSPTGKDQPSVLDAWREQGRRFSNISNLVTQGNGKPVYDPKPRLDSQASPEIGGFASVADYFVRSAYVSLSAGDPQTAERTFETALQFVYNLDNGTEGSGKAAGQAANRVFKGLDRALPKFGIQEADKMADAVTTLLGQEPSPLNNLRAIRRADVASVEQMLSNPAAAGQLASAVQSLNRAQRVATLRQFAADEDSYLQSVIQTAGQPEAKWQTVEFQEDNPVSEKLAKSSIAANGGLLQHAAKLRTKLRILRAMCRVTVAEWQNAELPPTIDSVVKSGELDDPLSGSKLAYAIQGKSFEVVSKGASWTGDVQLVDKVGP